MPSVAQIDGLNIPGGAPAISAPAAAYSVRLLDSALGVPTYTGAAMRVRRVTGAGQAGNDDEADVGFDSNDVISLESPVSNFSVNGSNATTLGQFLNAGTVNGITYTDADSLTNTAAAYVDGWKDQSGNGNDAEQTAPASQPQIHDGTVDTDLITENGKPAMDCANSALVAPSVTLDSYYSWYYVAKPDASGGFIFEHSADSNPNNGGYNYLGTNNSAEIYRNLFTATRNATAGAGYAGTSQTLIDWNYSGTWTAYKDGNTLAIAAGQGDAGDIGDSSATDELNLFSRNESSLFFNGKFQEIIFWNNDQDAAGNRTGIETNINEEYLIYQPTDQPTSGLLYDYGSATGGTDAAAAYSVRQLSDKAILCMRIRRDMGPGNPGDDDEINIGFDANGDVDTQAISDFCGTGTGWVTRWWDQSVNGNHADQPVGGTGSNTSQPQIYNGTAVITENGKPAVLSTLSTFFTMSTRLTAVQSVFNVLSPTDFTSSFVCHLLADSNQAQPDYHSGTSGVYLSNSYAKSSVINGDHYLNGSSVDLTATTRSAGQFAVDIINTTNDAIVGSISKDRIYNRSWVGTRQEIIIYETDQSSNVSGIQSNVNTHFSIY